MRSLSVCLLLGLAESLPTNHAAHALQPAGLDAQQLMCNTGAGAVPCRGSTSLRFINLADAVERRQGMEATLAALTRDNGMLRWQGNSSNASGFRFEAVSGACPERPPGNLEAACGAYACTLERSAFSGEWLQQHVSASYPPPSAGCSADCYSAFWASVPNTTLRGVLGVWSSHATVVHDYAAAAAAGTATDFLLVLEDDARLHPSFFEQLPSMLDQLPSDGAPWHALRFSTWNALDEADRLPGTDVYNVTRPLHTEAGLCHYCGAHATLIQRRTVHELLEHMKACGATSPDEAAYATVDRAVQSELASRYGARRAICTASSASASAGEEPPTARAADMARAAACTAPLRVYAIQPLELIYVPIEDPAASSVGLEAGPFADKTLAVTPDPVHPSSGPFTLATPLGPLDPARP